MKKLLRTVVALAAAVLAVSSIAEAQSVGTRPITYRYESGSVATGAIINSTVHNTSNLSRLTIICDNSLNSSSTRAMTITALESDCSTIAGTFTVTCTATGTNGGFTFVQIASDQPGVSTTGLTQIPIDPPMCLKVSVAAAGSVAGQLNIYGR